MAKKEMYEADDLEEIFEVETFADFTEAPKKGKSSFLSKKRILLGFAAILIAFCALSAVIGYQVGYRSIYGEGYETGYAEGSDLGYNEGLELGQKDGYDIGYEEGGAAAQNDLYYGIYGGEAADNAAAVGSSDMVYCTASGTCYHWEGCSYIAGKANLKTLSESEAIAAGYSACSRCGK